MLPYSDLMDMLLVFNDCNCSRILIILSTFVDILIDFVYHCLYSYIILLLFLCRSTVSGLPIASIHGSILALAACVLSVPYDMPR